MATTPTLGLTEMNEKQTNAHLLFNENLRKLEAFAAYLTVENDALTTAPGSPADGDVHIIAGTGGAWSTFTTGDVVVYVSNAWAGFTPVEGWLAYDKTSNEHVIYDGSAWTPLASRRSLTTGITASTTQTQGQQPLTTEFNNVTTVANANDVVTLPSVFESAQCSVKNNGVNTLQVFPASGDAIDGGSVNASVTIAAGAVARYVGVSVSAWETY